MKGNGQMKFSCGASCKGCPAYPMDRELFKDAYKQIGEHAQAHGLNTAQRLANMEIYIVCCERAGGLVPVPELREKGAV